MKIRITDRSGTPKLRFLLQERLCAHPLPSKGLANDHVERSSGH
jgi:hypothetical protein